MNILSPTIAICTIPAVAHGVIIIDTFTDVSSEDGIQRILIESSPTVTSDTLTSIQSGLDEVIGGTRAFTLTRVTTRDTGAFRVSGTVSDSQPPFFEYESSINADGEAVLSYGSESQRLNTDFSQNRLIQVLIAAYDLPENAPLVTSLTISSALGTTTPATVTAVNNLDTRRGVIIFDLDTPDFASIDFTDVDAISLKFDAPFAGDFNINTIVADDTPLTIPEPGVPALLGAALIGSLIRRSR